MSQVWKTKYGSRRVRHDPPTVEEAILAAQGLTDDPQQQVEIAASLMDLPVEKVKVEAMKVRTQRKAVQTTVAFASRQKSFRSVVVERRTDRRPMKSRPFVK